jgi:hypothetical protein
MPLNFPPFVVLTSHFRITGGHDLNPAAQTLLGEDQQLFNAFDQLAVQVMASAGVDPSLRPVVVTLASMSPGVSDLQRVQLATIFVRNAMAALNQPAPALANVMLPAAVARGLTRSRTKKKKKKKPKAAKASARGARTSRRRSRR